MGASATHVLEQRFDSVRTHLAKLQSQLDHLPPTTQAELGDLVKDLRAAADELERAADDVRRLKATETQVRGLLETAPDTIITVDVTGRMVLVNVQSEAMFGYQREELLGKPIEMLLPERFRARHVAHRADYDAHPERGRWGSA